MRWVEAPLCALTEPLFKNLTALWMRVFQLDSDRQNFRLNNLLNTLTKDIYLLLSSPPGGVFSQRLIS